MRAPPIKWIAFLVVAVMVAAIGFGAIGPS